MIFSRLYRGADPAHTAGGGGHESFLMIYQARHNSQCQDFMRYASRFHSPFDRRAIAARGRFTPAAMKYHSVRTGAASQPAPNIALNNFSEAVR
jgi:hypothetical protein